MTGSAVGGGYFGGLVITNRDSTLLECSHGAPQSVIGRRRQIGAKSDRRRAHVLYHANSRRKQKEARPLTRAKG